MSEKKQKYLGFKSKEDYKKMAKSGNINYIPEVNKKSTIFKNEFSPFIYETEPSDPVQSSNLVTKHKNLTKNQKFQQAF